MTRSGGVVSPSAAQATSGSDSGSGAVRYDSQLFFAKSARFVDELEALVTGAPDPVRWLILDAGALDDIDYSAGLGLDGLLDFRSAHEVTFMLARADDSLIDTLQKYGLRERIPDEFVFDSLDDAETRRRDAQVGA